MRQSAAARLAGSTPAVGRGPPGRGRAAVSPR